MRAARLALRSAYGRRPLAARDRQCWQLPGMGGGRHHQGRSAVAGDGTVMWGGSERNPEPPCFYAAKERTQRLWRCFWGSDDALPSDVGVPLGCVEPLTGT